MKIQAKLVQELRGKTGAGMMDCKRALAEAEGNLEQAQDWLRKRGVALASSKAGRVASEGLVALHPGPDGAALLEVNAETDFVARNAAFQTFVATAARRLYETAGLWEAFLKAPYQTPEASAAGSTSAPDVLSVEAELQRLIATIGENIVLRRGRYFPAPTSENFVAHYMHGALPDCRHLGRLGVVVVLDGDGSAEAHAALGHQLAMHIAARRPLYLSRDDISSEALARERDIFAYQARESGKSGAVLDQIIDGKLRKFFQETVLLEQAFILDEAHSVSQVLSGVVPSLAIRSFGFFVLGETRDAGGSS